MPKPTRTRVPAGEGGVANLDATYKDHRAKSRAGAVNILAELERRELAVNKANWEDVRGQLDEKCSWRTTYQDHLADLFGDLGRKSGGKGSEAEVQKMKERLRKALAVVDERDGDIAKLNERIAELEEDNARMSRGTVPRRRKKPVQGRHNETGDVGSD